MNLSPTLPGEPLSPAQENASAKIATIAGAYAVHRWLTETFFNPQDWSELTSEQLEFLSDHSIEREEASRDAIEDALWQFVRYECLSAEVCSGWYAAGSEAPEPQRWRVWLSVGGPSCYIAGTFGPRGIDESDTEVICSWAGPDQRYAATDAELEAIHWFALQLVV